MGFLNKYFKKLLLGCIIFFSSNFYAQSDIIRFISWNISDFGKTKNNEELKKIANIVKNADILAIQEVVSGYGGAQAVAKLSDILNRKGDKWDYVISDRTNYPKYTTERYAFIWKTKHIKIKNRGRLLTRFESIIDREPYLMEFFIKNRKITFINFHSRPFNRQPEIEVKALTQYISDSLKGPLILAGDFNMNESNRAFLKFKNRGYKSSVFNQKTTLRWSCKNGNYLNYSIDNIFYSKEISSIQTGVIDFVRFCENLSEARKLSDHLPVFLEFYIK
ncbi:endonuclease [Flavobacteriaceae bacterium R38]|nr:endonuclease [Flavobacteriaceae bacterium R38]